MSKINQTGVSIAPIPKSNKIQVSWTFTTLQKEGTNVYYVPGFEIFFGASNGEIAKKKALALVRIFFKQFLEHKNKDRIKSLVLELRKKGFRVPERDARVMGSFIKGIPVNADFKSNINEIPSFYSNLGQVHQTEMAVTC